MTDRPYRWRHHAYEADPEAIRAVGAALRHLLATCDDARAREVARQREQQALERRWQERVRVSPGPSVQRALDALDPLPESEAPPELQQALADPTLRAWTASSDPVQVPRGSWEALSAQLERHRRLGELGAPEVIRANERVIIARTLLELVAADGSCPWQPAPLPEVARLTDADSPLGEGRHAIADPWAVLERLVGWSRETWLPDLGIGAQIEQGPTHARFVEQHAETWPTRLGFWDLHSYRTHREDRVLDVYPDPDLWTVPGLALPRPVVAPDAAVDDRVAALLEAEPRDGPRPFSPARLGVGELGGPPTWASGEELVAWADQAPTAGALGGAMSSFAARCRGIGEQGGAVLSFVHLDAPHP